MPRLFIKFLIEQNFNNYERQKIPSFQNVCCFVSDAIFLKILSRPLHQAKLGDGVQTALPVFMDNPQSAEWLPEGGEDVVVVVRPAQVVFLVRHCQRLHAGGKFFVH